MNRRKPRPRPPGPGLWKRLPRPTSQRQRTPTCPSRKSPAASGSYVLEGGYVEHELLEGEEVEEETPYEQPHDGYAANELEEETLEPSSNGEIIGQTVRESGEERAMEDEEYDFSADELEEREMTPDEAHEAAEGGEAAARPAAPSTRYQRRGRGFERRGATL